MTRSNFTRAVSILGVILLAITFIGLGLWQWDRAQENRKPLVVDQKLVPLGDIARPSAALDSKAYLRNVSVTGKYISIFKAPNQSDSNGKSSSWDVGLLETKSRSAILVVRGLWQDHGAFSIDSQKSVTVIGKLMPHQNEDHADATRGTLQRLDSSVIVAITNDNLFDGYIVATSESSDGGEINRGRISAAAPQSAVPGFYWQHISYVIIWWVHVGPCASIYPFTNVELRQRIGRIQRYCDK